MNTSNVRLYGQIATSVLSLVIFCGCLIVSFYAKDSQMELLVVGAAIANATTVVNYWLGSSSGSTQKTELLDSKPPTPPHQP